MLFSPLLMFFPVCDLVVNKKCKEFANNVTCTEIAANVARQLASMEVGGVSAISVDIRLTALKPMVVHGMVDAVQFFDSAEGAALISKGFELARIAPRCWTNAFQEQAVAWARRLGPSAFNPQFTPATDMPPSAASHSLQAIALVTSLEEEELESGFVL